METTNVGKDGQQTASISPTSSNKSRPKGMKISRNHKQIYGRTKIKQTGLDSLIDTSQKLNSFQDLSTTLPNQAMAVKHVPKG